MVPAPLPQPVRTVDLLTLRCLKPSSCTETLRPFNPLKRGTWPTLYPEAAGIFMMEDGVPSYWDLTAAFLPTSKVRCSTPDNAEEP